MGQREIAKNEHTQNIKSGIPVLNTMYGFSIDEYDYLDIAVNTLRDIKNFGTKEYVSFVTVKEDGSALVPCNLDSIDAVTTEFTGKKIFIDRIEYDLDGIEGTDSFYDQVDIIKSIGYTPYGKFLSGRQYDKEGYVSYIIQEDAIKVSNGYAGDKIAIAYSGIIVDQDGYPVITRKQANAIAAKCALILCLKGANSGDQIKASLVEYYTNLSGRLIQAAAIPEDITDNEMDEVLNAKTSFNRKSYNRTTKYSR